MPYSRRTPLLAFTLALAACSDERPPEPLGPPPVATVRVRASAPQVTPGDSVALSAEPLDAAGRPVTGATVRWEWSDSTALAGAADGVTLRARALRPAVVQVTAVSGTVRGTVDVTLRYPDPVALRFTLAMPDSVVVGAQPTVAVVAVDSLGRTVPSQAPVITSSDTSVAIVNATSTGLRLFTLRPGRTEVVATLGALRATASVRVWPAPRYLFPDTSALLPGLTRTLRAQELPVDQRASIVAAEAWRSSAPAVATVSAAGVVTAVAPGQATISAVSGGDTLRALVVVKAPAAPVQFVAVGTRASCAVARDGGIYCWGSAGTDPAANQLGTTELVDRCEAFQPFSGAGRMWYVRSVSRCSALPVRVQSASRFVAVSGNSAGGVCGLTDTQTVECWGSVPTAARTSPVPVPIAAGLRVAALQNSCLLTTSGEVHCWGGWVVPMYEDGTRDSRTPQRVPSPVAFRQLSVGSAHLCGVTAEDATYCWGSNYTGQLGIAVSTQAPGCFTACEPHPQPVPGLPATSRVQVAEASACALDAQGAVRCWGEPYANGRTAASPTPAPIPDAPPFATLTSGGSTYCGLTAGGEVWCWGSIFSRPDGTQQLSTPRAVRAAPTFPLRTLGVSPAAMCGIATDALLYCWGQGLLGDGEYETSRPWRLVKVGGQ